MFKRNINRKEYIFCSVKTRVRSMVCFNVLVLCLVLGGGSGFKPFFKENLQNFIILFIPFILYRI